MARMTGIRTPVESCQRLKKGVLDASLPDTQLYKIQIKRKWSNPGKSIALPYTMVQ